MDEFQKEEEFLFEENEENIVIKYKLLRSLIIKHYNRGCKYLEIAKARLCSIFLDFYGGRSCSLHQTEAVSHSGLCCG